MANETSPQKLHAAFQAEAMTGPVQDLSKLREPIPIERVDFRIQSINKAGYAKLLAYKDARVDMDRLDAVVGLGCWQRKHEDICGNLFGAVGIFNERLQQWVWVQDVGVESKTEKEKGEASDSFKRACFNLGIGRELYNYPDMQVKLLPHEWELDEKTQKGKQTWGLKLREWTWTIKWRHDNDGRYEVEHLYGHDEKGNIRFKYPEKNSNPEGKTATSKAAASIVESKASTDSKPTVKEWYNDFENHKDIMIEKLDNGETTVDEIIDALKEKFKMSKATEDKIRNLEKPY